MTLRKNLPFNISLLVVVFLGLTLQLEASNNDSFPNIFQHMIGKDRFRFYYELNWFLKNKFDPNNKTLISKLFDESYSFNSNSGRLLVNNGATPKLTNDYSIFYWHSNTKLQESFWLKPFICPSVLKEASAAPTESGLLFSQDVLYEMFSFNGGKDSNSASGSQFVLQGLSALLANIVQNHATNLKRIDNPIEDKEQKEAEKQVIRWLLDTNSGYWLEFNFRKWSLDEKLSFEHIVGLRIIIFKSIVNKDGNKEPGAMMGQLTVLKANYHFPDSLVKLPRGYSCHHSALKLPFQLTNTPLANLGDSTVKYTIEVTITSGNRTQEPLELNERLHLHSPQSVPEPKDSLVAPISNSSILVLIVDHKENSLSIVSRLDDFKRSSKQQANLTVWDFNTKRYHKVLGSYGSCEGPLEFKSSLQLSGKADEQPEAEGNKCSEDAEQVLVQLSDTMGIRLTRSGLKWLTFDLQNRLSLSQMVEFAEISNGEYEINYEDSARDLNLCLFYLETGKPVEFTSVRLSTSYKYLPEQDLWFPKSSSLQFFDTSQSQLIMQIDLRLAHLMPFRPWITEHHQIDLSACKSGSRQSAKLLLEYPLDNSRRDLLYGIHEPYEHIRSALFAYLATNYHITLARVPSISVTIRDELISVEARLLDQVHLLHDSERLKPINTTSSSKYLDWLSLATRSVLVSSLQSCAEYCQLYRCEVYVFCKYSSSCYIYSPLAVSNNVSMPLQPASYSNMDMICSAFRVLPHRSESQTEQQRATTWNLDEILESIQQSINDMPVIESLSNITQSKKNHIKHLILEIPPPYIRLPDSTTPATNLEPNVGQSTIELNPLFAHYQFDNPRENSIASSVYNPFISNKNKGLLREEASKQEVGFNTNFRIALSGHRLVELSDLSVVTHHNQLQHLDLDSTDTGYLSVDGIPLEDCLRICLTDTSCASVSYCSTDLNNCLVSRLNQTGLSVMQATDEKEDRSKFGGLLLHLKLEENPTCSIMMRTYSDQFERLELNMIFTYLGQPLNNVLAIVPAKDPEECASFCALNRLQNLNSPLGLLNKSLNSSSTTCRSYDFCQPFSHSIAGPSGCIFYTQHLVSKSEHLELIRGDHGAEMGKTKQTTNNSSYLDVDVLSVLKDDIGLNSSSFCWHYVRNFMSDFHKINGQKLPAEMRSLTMRNFNLPEIESGELQLQSATQIIDGSEISLASCGRLCEEDPNCGAFEYCALSHSEVPGGLYLSCSLGTNETLAMVPVGRETKLKSKSAKSPQRYIRDMMKLARHKFCSVYIYKALSLIAGHKKKNLRQVRADYLEDISKREAIAQSNLFRFDLILFGVFFLFGLIVRDLDLSQFSFQRLHESLDRPNKRFKADRVEASISLGEINMETMSE